MTRLSTQVGGIMVSIGALLVARAAFGRGHDRKDKTAGADCKGSGLTASSNKSVDAACKGSGLMVNSIPTKTAGVACKGSYPTASSNGDSTIEGAKKGDGAVMAAQEDALAMEKDHGEDAVGQETKAASSGGKKQKGQEGKKGKEQCAPGDAVKAGLTVVNKRVQLQKGEPVAAQADALAKKDQGHDAVGQEAEAKEAGSGGKDQQGRGHEDKKGEEQSAPGGTIRAGLRATNMRVQLQRERQVRVVEEMASWAANSSRIYREKFEEAQADLKESKKRCSELGKEVDQLKEKVKEAGYDVVAWKAVARKLTRRLAMKSRVVSVGVVRRRKALAAARAAGQDVASDAEGQDYEAEVVDQEEEMVDEEEVDQVDVASDDEADSEVVDEFEAEEEEEASEGAESEEDEQSEAEAGMVDEAEASGAEAEQEGQQDQEEEDEEEAGGGGPVVRTIVMHKYAQGLVRITEEVEEGEACEALRGIRAGLRCTSHPLQDMEDEDDEQDEQ